MDKPNYARYKGYDIDLHYDEDAGDYYCSAWRNGKGIHEEPTDALSCCEYTASYHGKDSVRLACIWLDKYIIGNKCHA